LKGACFLTTVRDVTERVLKEIAIREEQKHLRKEEHHPPIVHEEDPVREHHGKSQAMQKVFRADLKAAKSTRSVCNLRESGTRKRTGRSRPFMN